MPIHETIQMNFLLKILDEHLKTYKFSKIAVGVSGGPDSLCLTLSLKQWCDQKNISLVALTVDHKLRLESSNEAKKVQEWLSEKEIEHHILNWEHGIVESHIQEQARNARYNLMTDFCHKNNIPALCLGHHLQDQLETFSMRLFKGSGIEGLSGMKGATSWNDIQILRPFLTMEKETLLDALKSIDQDFLIDPSNDDLKFERVKWRRLGLPIESLDGFAQAVNRLQSVNQFIDETVEDAWADCVKDNELSINCLLQLHECVATRILSRILQAVSGKPYPCSYEKLVEIFRSLQNNTLKATSAGGCVISKNKNNLVFIIDERIKNERIRKNA